MVRFALIPVKELAQAKARLAPVLDAAARRRLALAMFRDVLEAALACSALDGVAVVSRDDAVLTLGWVAGAKKLLEPGDLNNALTSAGERLARRGVDRIVVLAADLPLATPEAIEAVALAEAAVAVVRSPDGGTNALALPPGASAFRFGPDSARRHLEAAQQAGLRAVRLDLPELALDIDTPADLSRLRDATSAGRTVGSHTVAALVRFGLVPESIRGG